MDNELRELYQQVILDHNKSPRNFKKLEDANHHAEGHNPLCGDRIDLQLRIEDDKIKEVRFRGEGCAVSTATSSILTDFIKGKKLSEVESLTAEGVLSLLGMERLAPARIKCALLSWQALRSVLAKYHHDNSRPNR